MKDKVLGELRKVMDPGEARAVAMLLFDQLAQLSTADVLLGKADKLPESTKTNLMQAIARIVKGEPVQYVVGYVDFAGVKLTVSPAALIPRPETEEMVHLILSENHNTPIKSILDIGTGSGCIALALKKNMPEAIVKAWDISTEALTLASINAKDAGLDVIFEQHDILKPSSKKTNSYLYDIIVSNPPYVCENEKNEMEPHVLNHEPPTALFVPDDDPLLFYKAIAFFAVDALTTDGQLYVEVNRKYAHATKNVFEQAGLKRVDIIKDQFGNQRFVTARKHGKEETD